MYVCKRVAVTAVSIEETVPLDQGDKTGEGVTKYWVDMKKWINEKTMFCYNHHNRHIAHHRELYLVISLFVDFHLI